MTDQAYPRYMEKLPERFSIKHKITEDPKNTFHRHHEAEILFALSDMKCHFENGIVDVPKYGLLLLSPSDLHCIDPIESDGLCDRYVLYFSSNYISEYSTPEVNLLECFMLRAGHQPVVLAVPEKEQPHILDLMQRMEYFHKATKEETPTVYGAALQLRFLLGELLLAINRMYFDAFHLDSAPVSLGHTQLVFDISEYIRSHYREPLTTGSIANTFFLSKTQLYHIFKETTGLTVSDFLTEYRITQAKNLLINSDYSVEMISGAVGYTNLSSFSRTFKSIAKVSPLQYRKKMLEAHK